MKTTTTKKKVAAKPKTKSVKGAAGKIVKRTVKKAAKRVAKK